MPACAHTACQLKLKSNSKPHRLLKRNFRINIFTNDFKGCGGEIYFKAPVCVHTYTCNHMLYMIQATHAWQFDVFAKAIDTFTKCFSNFLFGFSPKGPSEEEMHNLNERDGVNWRQKTLKPFLHFVAVPRFFPLFPRSSSMLLFVFWSSKLSNKIPLLPTATHRICFH